MDSEEFRNPWRRLSARQVYDNPWISVREDEVVRPDGQPGIYGVVHFKNIAVGVLAVEEDSLYLVGQYRYTLERYSWEIPEGGCAPGEDPLEAARRELEEETGLRARRWLKLGEAHLSNSATDELAFWYLAEELERGDPRPEGTERLLVRRVGLKEALEMTTSGEITDALSMLAIMQFHLRRGSV
ncbi:MAG: NUDIX hydrolase [Acidobacteriota bacterium]|nr:NUDIX hydrolase [Acidobacteriota bacterium]MDQ5836406.1 NUDIX hydrolase [Acidobacteriota bacterium]